MINDVNCCWGDPDSVMYTVEGEDEIHELDLRNNGYVFGIWDGVFVQGGDDDDTAGLMHDEFLLYYIYYNGWPKRNIVPLKDINEDAWDYDVAKNIPVEYDNYSYYDDDENVLPEYQMTYGDLLEKLGSPKARGRVLVDHNNGWIGFVAFWGEPTLEEKKLVYKNVGNQYVVIFNNINEAREFYLYEGNKVFTFKEWIQSGKYIPRIKKDEEAFALHNMKAKDKWNNTVTFRDVRDTKNAKKLGKMTMAQYNSLKYQESKNMIKNSINEAEIKRRFKNLISTTQLLKRIAQYGYQGDYTEQALYQLLDKYGIKPKTKRGGKSYFNKKNACTCIERHIFELKELAERLSQQNSPQEEPEWNVGYGRNNMSVASRECLANDDIFGADENKLYRTDENILNFKSIVNEAIEEDYGQYPMPSIDDIEGEKMTTMYRVAFKNQLDSIFEFGYNRAFTGSKGGNMYGAGVYCTYKLEDSIHNVKTKPEYGDCIVKMFLIGGFDGFITFDEHNARRMYGKFWRIKDQLIHRYGVDSFEAERIERRCSLADGDLYHGRTAPAAYSFVTNCRNLIKEKGIRGVIYKGNRDGHCVVPYDFSAVIPYSVSFDQGKTFKKMFKPETYQRMQDSIDVQFRYGNKYAKVFESVKGFTMVQNRAGKYNFVDNSDDKELSPYWFDEVLSKINPNNGTFGFKFKGHDFIGSIIAPQGSSEKGCIMDDGQPYCDFSDLPDLVNAIENGEA